MTAPTNTLYERYKARGGRWEGIRGASKILEAVSSREQLVLGAYDPVDFSGPTPETFELTPLDQVWAETNRVGIISSDSLTTMVQGTNQTVSHTTPGAAYLNTVFTGYISVGASGITYQNCLFIGPASLPKPSVVQTGTSANPITFIDCTFIPQNPNRWAQAWVGGSGKATFIRCDFYAQSDAITPGGAWTNGVTIIQCAFHDMIMYGPDPGAAGGIDDAQTHVDQTQFITGSRCIIRGSGYSGYYHPSTRYMEAALPPQGWGGTGVAPLFHYYGHRNYPDMRITSNVMMSPATSLIEFEVSDSYLRGGASSINCAGVASISERFDFLRNHVAVDGPIRPILAKVGIQPQINCVGNVDFYTGAALSKAQLIQNGA